jgi:hypothetical protein
MKEKETLVFLDGEEVHHVKMTERLSRELVRRSRRDIRVHQIGKSRF